MRILIVTRGYPSASRLYNHSFVHRRVLAYRRLGHDVTTFWLHRKPPITGYEFDGIPVLVGDTAKCLELIRTLRPDAAALHAPADDFGDLIRQIPRSIPVNGWIYGSEIMPFYRVTERQDHNAERWAKARAVFDRRIAFWQDLIAHWPENLRLVFVSDFAAQSAFAAAGAEIPRWTVLPSPVDTALFQHAHKQADDRFEVLSIRPFSDWRYAGDLAVKAICAMQGHPLFERFRFRFHGEGHLFEETVLPLRAMPNVMLEPRFVTQAEIPALHACAGLFLCPTRDDAQGVSRDEAMSSGLVPITNAAGAVPEFADAGCAWLAPPEDHADLARGMLSMAENPAVFLAKSAAAAARIRSNISADRIIPQELDLLGT